MNIGRWQILIWRRWVFGIHRWSPSIAEIYGKYAVNLGPLEIRRFRRAEHGRQGLTGG